MDLFVVFNQVSLLEFALFSGLIVSLFSLLARPSSWSRRIPTPHSRPRARSRPRPPLVPGSLPILGHWWQLSKDPVGFLRAAYLRHGPIFQVNILRNRVTFVCSRELREEFYDATEEHLSLSGLVKTMKMELIFMDRLAEWWPTINKLARHAITTTYSKFGAIIKEGAEQAMADLAKSRDLETELGRYVMTVPPKCLLNAPSTELLGEFKHYNKSFKLLLFFSYLLPNWLINPVIWTFARLYVRASQIGSHFLPEIRKYFKDPTYNASLLTRLLVDQEFGPNGYKLTEMDVKNLSLLMVHKTSENTMNLLRNTLIDLAANANKEWYAKARDECAKYVDGFHIVDTKGILESKLLQACIMESARLNANVVMSKRQVFPHSTIGGYYIGHTDEVASCSTFFMVEGSDYHRNSLQYNPGRYVEGGEAYTRKYITSWGAGEHLCPGKALALNTVKMFVALLVTNYDIKLKDDSDGKATENKSYFTISSFIIRRLNAEITPINEETAHH